MSTITAFVAAFDAKALNCTELFKPTWLVGTGLLTSVFVICVKKTNTLHQYSMCDVIKTLKPNVRTTLQLACHACKNVTHTSKTRHEKCIQMVVTVRFKIRMFLTFLER